MSVEELKEKILTLEDSFEGFSDCLKFFQSYVGKNIDKIFADTDKSVAQKNEIIVFCMEKGKCVPANFFIRTFADVIDKNTLSTYKNEIIILCVESMEKQNIAPGCACIRDYADVVDVKTLSTRFKEKGFDKKLFPHLGRYVGQDDDHGGRRFAKLLVKNNDELLSCRRETCGCNALHFAAEDNHEEWFLYLLNKMKGNVELLNAKDKKGLLVAQKINGNKKMAQALIDAGADCLGKTAKEIAAGAIRSENKKE